MLFTGELGPMGNWAFSLLAVSIGGCVFLLRGIGNSGWSVSLLGVVAVIGPAIIMFLFGIHGLIAVVLMSLILALRVISRRES